MGVITRSDADVAVVIVNWNSGSQLNKCLQSLSHLALTKIVVDNGSSDESLACIENYSDVRVISLKYNAGFSRACNIGARDIKAKYLLFLNPDALVFDNSISASVEFMESPASRGVGICGVQLVNKSTGVSRSCSRFPNPSRIFFKSLGVTAFFPKLGAAMLDWEHNSDREVDQVIGAYFFVRTNLFHALRGFDERFFVYFEEVDFSLRAKMIGWRSFYLSGVQAFHAGGGTSEQVKAKRLFYTLRSRLIYSSKNFSLMGLLVVLISTLFIEPISRSVLWVVRRSWSSLVDTWVGYCMLFIWLASLTFKGKTK